MFRGARRYIMIGTTRAITIYLAARRAKLIKVLRRTPEIDMNYTQWLRKKNKYLCDFLFSEFIRFYSGKIATSWKNKK